MLLPRWKSKKENEKYKNLKIYEILVAYVHNKLCIKEYLKNINEVEKLKYILFSKDNLKIIESKQNIFPKSREIKSIWDEENMNPIITHKINFNDSQ
jgi:hypothetical protein